MSAIACPDKKTLYRRSLRFLAIGLLVSASLISAPSHADDDALSEGVMLNLVSLVSTRLAQARPIAAWQWHHHSDNTNPEQDKVDMDGIMKVAPHYGLDAAYAQTFFQDQDTATHQVQTALLKEWKGGSPPPKPEDAALENSRAELYRLDQAMLSGLARAAPLRTQPNCPMLLSRAMIRWTTQMTTLDPIEKSGLKTALSHVCGDAGIGASA